VVGNEHEVARNFTWTVLVTEDGKFKIWEVSLEGAPIIKTYINFSCNHFCCFTIAPLFVLDKSMSWNRCLQHPCFKNLCKIAQASKA
jgi:hypothetical protein